MKGTENWEWWVDGLKHIFGDVLQETQPKKKGA